MISMLKKNYEILCKLNSTQNNITVNDVIKAVSHQFKNVATKIIDETINDIQNVILDEMNLIIRLLLGYDYIATSVAFLLENDINLEN